MYSPVLSRDGGQRAREAFGGSVHVHVWAPGRWTGSISLGFFRFRAACCSTTDKCQPIVIMWFDNSSFLTSMTVPFHHLSQSNPTKPKHFFAVMETACKTVTQRGLTDFKEVKFYVKFIVKKIAECIVLRMSLQSSSQ